MRRTFLGTLGVLALLVSGARAQVIYVGPGSTVEGDYLRGLGIAAYGEGVFNQATAVANSINADTMIRWNEYVSAVVKNENREAAEHRALLRTRRNAGYEKVRRRILDTPHERDVQNGDTLNALMDELKDPRHDESSFRFNAVPLPVDIVRKIPFKIDAQGQRFSMERISTRGNGKWPVALQDPRFAVERRGYERALDNALEQQIEGKMSLDAIAKVEVAAEDLSRKLERVVPPSGERLFIESRDRIKELKETAGLLKSLKIQLALGELDRYSGTTVHDLKMFMEKYKLTFDSARTPEEPGAATSSGAARKKKTLLKPPPINQYAPKPFGMKPPGGIRPGTK